MPIQRQININKSGGGIAFSPATLNANTSDQIFWTNNDDKPHWPGLADGTGKVTNPTFFMPNQIAPNGDTSPIFSASTGNTFQYACSLHPNETGSIKVT
jgi:plastocyanin